MQDIPWFVQGRHDVAVEAGGEVQPKRTGTASTAARVKLRNGLAVFGDDQGFAAAGDIVHQAMVSEELRRLPLLGSVHLCKGPDGRHR